MDIILFLILNNTDIAHQLETIKNEILERPVIHTLPHIKNEQQY